MENFKFFDPILRKNGFRVEKWEKWCQNKNQFCVSIFSQHGELWLFLLKFAKKWILKWEFQKSKSRFGISTSKIPCVPIFNQRGQLRFFSVKNLRKLHNYLQYFGEGVAESWVEGDMSWVETEMGWMELGGTRWRWMDLGGAGGGWFWVEVGGGGCTV